MFDLTLVLADVSEKALAQVKRGAVELLTPRMEQAAAEALAAKLAGGTLDARLRAHRQRGGRAGPARQGRLCRTR